MRCLHCGNRISLLRKLKDSEFCSDEHRDFYALQQQQLAVSRLMETSSPKHKPLPGLQHEPETDRGALPQGADRRGIESAPAPPKEAAPSTNRRGPVEAAVAPQPPAKPAAVVRPVYRNSTRAYDFVPNPMAPADWSPGRWHTVEPEAEDLHPMLAAPRLERTTRKRVKYGRMLAISRSHEWGRMGRLIPLPYCETPVGPAWASTFSEILSLSMHGFVCERALTLDRTPYVAPPAPKPEAPSFAGSMPESAEAGLGAGQLPRVQCGGVGLRAVETVVSIDMAGPARPAGVIRANLALRGKLPEIDWTVERLDRIAARNEPGLVRLRSPRVRSPQLARLVKPAAGSSGPPIRVRPTVRPPQPSPFRTIAVMPSGAKRPLEFDRPVAGVRKQFSFVEEPQQFQFTVRREMARPEADWRPGIAFGGLVALPLVPASGLALTEGVSGADLESSFALKMPAAPFVRSPEFDPPWGGLVRLALKVESRRGGPVSLAKPALRPVVSYRWGPVNPELLLKLDADWDLSTRNLSQLTLGATVSRQALSLAPPGSEPMIPVIQASFAGVRLILKKSARSTTPVASTKMLPVSLEECTAKPGVSTPKSKLEHIAPKPGHQLRKSSLKTQADWQRSKWSSASVYGSALWRIAIGKFSGALGDASKPVRWLAGVVALALGAFALLPGDGPAAPKDTGWTIAANPGTPVAEAPPPKRVRVAPPPPRVAAKVPKPVRVQTAQGGNPASPGASLTGAWDNLQKRLSERAAVAYTDDFRNGLAEWEGAGDWARSWSYDASGFVRTGGLAVLASGKDLTDYRMEFLGQIERRSMGWVVRAADLRNYYALKLTIVSDGPQPEVALIRYPVINGAAGAASQQLLTMDARTDTVYRVQTEVRDDYYAVTVQGKVVDSWTDSRLKRGSIGLFSGKGELARVRWVGVWHQYDTLGRLCALLAPSGLPGRERGANQ
jgi:hypothetical protein